MKSGDVLFAIAIAGVGWYWLSKHPTTLAKILPFDSSQAPVGGGGPTAQTTNPSVTGVGYFIPPINLGGGVTLPGLQLPSVTRGS